MHEVLRQLEAPIDLADLAAEEISDEEREWLMRINHVWKNGVQSGLVRELA